MITVLWAYDKFYKGQEPQGVHERGQWLLKIYVEATSLLEPKENETPEKKPDAKPTKPNGASCIAIGTPAILRSASLWRKTRAVEPG